MSHNTEQRSSHLTQAEPGASGSDEVSAAAIRKPF
jgi:hypothetical protein